MKISLHALILLALLIAPVASAACVKKGVVVVEIEREAAARNETIIINGKSIGHGEELPAVRSACALRMVVLLGPRATLGDLLNFGFIAAKSGFDERSDRYLAFARSTDKTRMTYLKTMAIIRYSNDRKVLEKIALSPPERNNFM